MGIEVFNCSYTVTYFGFAFLEQLATLSSFKSNYNLEIALLLRSVCSNRK